ncbi:hypothetical protein Syn7502_01179 [Synechococcus sp. PCC 7502]|uniref:hypothetical protein n=1 Tax=Synechococcus sp. PCC 7502 TaxID=1173263 RepID=UPI00029FA753|nr:hypothetical protein [Synechococcus sp. PCC 7502]AFY73282.1 hypothetical protein Syn7502_01179 [Synechococcus sp. PCC 7502]
MKLKTIISALGLAGLSMMSQVASARAVPLNFTGVSTGGNVFVNSVNLGAYKNINPSFTIDPSLISYTKVTDTNYVLDITNVGIKFVTINSSITPPANLQDALNYFATLRFTGGTGSFKATITSYNAGSSILSIKYNGGVSFTNNNLNPSTLNLAISGVISLSNYGNFDPTDFPTYLGGNLEIAALNNYTITENDTFAFRNGDFNVVSGKNANYIASIDSTAVPFNFNSAEGVIVSVPLLIGVRFLRKKLVQKQKEQRAVEKVI